MAEIGWSSLLISFLVSCLGLGFSLKGWLSKNYSIETQRSLSRISILSFCGILISYIILVALFLQDRFDISAVYKFSERSLDPIYKISATWSGMEGSLLFWTLNLSAFAILALSRFPTYRGYGYYFISLLFLLSLTLFLANPFRYTEAIDISDGLGLNPLLHNVYMLIHPIVIYMGLNSTIYLLIKQLSSVRKSYDLTESLGWIFLTSGIALGGYWAYIELGWGGYWAWDPVENSSFIPWLAYTAYLHLYKYGAGANLMLITAAIAHFYSVIGTFITRSGIVLSVHTFANSDVAWYLQWYVWFALIAVCVLFITSFRLGSLFKTKIDRIMFLNWLNLMFFALSVLWGVLYGPFSEIFFEDKIILGIPFFEKISAPYFGLNFLLMPLGIACWLGIKGNKLGLIISTLAGVFVAALAYLQGSYSTAEIMFLALFGFNAVYLLQLLRNVVTGRQIISVLIHLMVLVIAVGILFSYGRKVEKNVTLQKETPTEILGRTVIFERLEVERNNLFEEVRAVILVDGQMIKPASRYYFKKSQLTAETAIRKDLIGDLYFAIVEIDPGEEWISVKVFYSPLIVLVWAGIVGLVFLELFRVLSNVNQFRWKQSFT